MKKLFLVVIVIIALAVSAFAYFQWKKQGNPAVLPSESSATKTEDAIEIQSSEVKKNLKYVQPASSPDNFNSAAQDATNMGFGPTGSKEY